MDYPLGSVERRLTKVAHHIEYFHSDSANLTRGVSQQTGVKVKKTGDRSLWVCACQGPGSLSSSFPMACSLGLVTCGVCVVREASVGA